MPPIVLVVIGVCVAAVPVIWMWTRMREERTTSLDDYVAQSKARAQAELGTYLKPDEPEKK